MQKLKSKQGVTIVELLSVLVVVILLSAIMVTGIALAAKSYVQSVSRSEALVLCSTLSNAVKDELRFASFVSGEGENFTYWSNRNGQDTHFANQDGIVALERTDSSMLLISKSNYSYGNTADLKVTYDKSAGIFYVQIQVLNKAAQVVAESAFQVRCLNSKGVTP